MKTRVSLVQQGVWGKLTASMPLAVGYLKASANADERIRQRTEISIHNYAGDASLSAMARDLIRADCPDILCCSVLGWNYRTFGALAETFKQANPGGWVIFGGNHVANQAERVFRMNPAVDIVVNGEGELVFVDLLNAYLDGASSGALQEISGISFQETGGGPVTTPARARVEDLDSLPSPILSGSIPLTDDFGRFRYDFALMETNRGCPYKCAFCYWGGATGQRIRAFSRERLRAELEVIGRHRAERLMLCDSNFGLLREDEEFVDDLLRVRRKYGYPRQLDTSWAKNKSAGFYQIMTKLQAAGLRNSFILSLQTMDDTVLDRMRRRNMKLNEWEDIVGWLTDHDITTYVELIWGAPGETSTTFLDGYDRAARHTPFIAVHPLMLLPNTEYHDKRADYELVTVRGEQDDFDYVLAHPDMTVADHEKMLRFICWNRVLARSLWLHDIWVALRELADMPQSRLILSFADWIEAVDDPAAAELHALARPTSSASESVDPNVWRLLTTTLLQRWWTEAVRPSVPEDLGPVLDEVFRHDLTCQPIRPLPDDSGPAENLPTVHSHGGTWYVRRDVSFAYDIPTLMNALRRGERVELHPSPFVTSFYYRTGFGIDGQLNHYFQMSAYRGLTEQELAAQYARTTVTTATPT